MARALGVLLLVASSVPPWGSRTEDEVVVGKATYMFDYRMREVRARKGSSLPLHKLAAGNREGDLGRWVWLQWADGSVDGPLLLVDCAGRGADYLLREKQGRVVEVSGVLARRRGFFGVGPVPVVVWFDKPPRVRWD